MFHVFVGLSSWFPALCIGCLVVLSWSLPKKNCHLRTCAFALTFVYIVCSQCCDSTGEILLLTLQPKRSGGREYLSIYPQESLPCLPGGVLISSPFGRGVGGIFLHFSAPLAFNKHGERRNERKC